MNEKMLQTSNQKILTYKSILYPNRVQMINIQYGWAPKKIEALMDERLKEEKKATIERYEMRLMLNCQCTSPLQHFQNKTNPRI